MFKELIYLGSGIEKRIVDTVESLIEEGKQNYEGRGIVDIARENLKNRKKQVQKMFLNDIKSLTKELGIATKKDIEEIKEYIKKGAV